MFYALLIIVINQTTNTLFFRIHKIAHKMNTQEDCYDIIMIWIVQNLLNKLVLISYVN